MDSIVLDHLSVAVMAIDENFTIKVANKRCKEILGIDPEEALGQNIDEFFGHPPEITRTVQHTLEQGKNFRYDVFPYTWGKYELTLSQRSTLLKDDNNQIKGAMVEFEDITERHKMEEQYKNFIEESTVNIILVDDKIGMHSLHFGLMMCHRPKWQTLLLKPCNQQAKSRSGPWFSICLNCLLLNCLPMLQGL